MDLSLEFWASCLCVLVPIVIYYLLKATKPAVSFTACDSPECVRCSKYEQIRLLAFDKLCEFSNANRSSTGLELKRLFLAVDQQDSSPSSHPKQQPNVLFVRGLKAEPWWNPESFKTEVNILERNAEAIEEEYELIQNALHKGDTAGWARNNTSSGQWNVFYFYNQGVKNERNCRRCPKTSYVLDGLQGLMRNTLFFNASFSVLRADTLIDEHYGPTNTRIRCHLGLKVPENCHLTVCGISKQWRKGKCLLFDDSFLHSAQNYNPRGGSRVVLLLDFWHPDLTDTERKAIEYVF